VVKILIFKQLHGKANYESNATWNCFVAKK
jgi:hypothetical protein